MAKLALDVDKGLYLGIDFGTTNSVVSIFHYDEDRVDTVEIEGSSICPTAIAFDESFEVDEVLEKIYGIQAKEGAVIYPESTVLGIKRRLSDDKAIEIIVEDETYEFSPVQIAGEIIAYLKDQADTYMRENYGVTGQFEGCVITVPANSIDKQKLKTKEAAVLAGFLEEQVHIRLEPAAAAISYASTVTEDKKVLVYDFGGGTFDACLLAIDAKSGEPEIKILSTYGDNRLGGDDIDQIMVDMIYDSFLSQTDNTIDLFDLSKDDGVSKKQKKMAQVRLKQVANSAKEKLSKSMSTKVVMAPFLQEPEVVNINLEISVESFIAHKRKHQLGDDEEVFNQFVGKSVTDLTKKTIECCDVCLEAAEVNKESVDQVFLVGGSSAIPLVGEMMTDHFGQAPYQSKISPALSISRGAAKYAQMIAMPNASGLLVSETTIHSLGLEMAGRRYLEVVAKGIEIPDEGLVVSLEEPLTTNHDGLTSMVLVVYESLLKNQGVSYVFDEGMKRLGGTTLKGIPKNKKGQEAVAVTFTISKDNLLTVNAKSLSTEGLETQLTVEALYE